MDGAGNFGASLARIRLPLRSAVVAAAMLLFMSVAGARAQVGACCSITSTTCLPATRTQCGFNLFLGEGTTCSPNPCGGACCLIDGTCLFDTAGLCVAIRQGHFRGNGTTCSSGCPVVGACCALDGTCRILPSSDCTTGFTAGTACSAVTCVVRGACCSAIGLCSIVADGTCTGNYSRGVACSAGYCLQVGACCHGLGCSTQSRFKCAGASIDFLGAATSCSPVNACCPPDFNLSFSLTVQDIFDFLAAYFGNNLRADFNGSGGISVQDIFDFLAAYFAGCL